MEIEMTIKGLMIDPITNMPIIILRDQDGQRMLPDLGGRLRGQRHRAPDRERPDAAADDPRPAEEHASTTSTRAGRAHRGLRAEGEHVLRDHPPAHGRGARSRWTPGRPTPSPWPCAPSRRSSSRRRSSRAPAASRTQQGIDGRGPAPEVARGPVRRRARQVQDVGLRRTSAGPSPTTAFVLDPRA